MNKRNPRLSCLQGPPSNLQSNPVIIKKENYVLNSGGSIPLDKGEGGRGGLEKNVSALWLCHPSVIYLKAKAKHPSTDLKMFLNWRLDTFTSFTHFLVGWNLENLRKHAVSIFFSLKLTVLVRKTRVFGKHLYCKTRTDSAYKLHVQVFVTG